MLIIFIDVFFQMVILVRYLPDYRNSWMIAQSTRLNEYISKKIRNLRKKFPLPVLSPEIPQKPEVP